MLSDRILMFIHGTTLAEIPAGVVITAAQDDVALRAEVIEGTAMRRAYCFLAEDVRAAESPQHMIQLALKRLDERPGRCDILNSSKPSVHILYR
jgi:hypothetical protein